MADDDFSTDAIHVLLLLTTAAFFLFVHQVFKHKKYIIYYVAGAMQNAYSVLVSGFWLDCSYSIPAKGLFSLSGSTLNESGLTGRASQCLISWKRIFFLQARISI